ncbi:MFS transporter [Bradyrhizobium sp. 174]|uniref:MFS transporter n=1 Tax=Bradyrhizobium sp. 174 TaxID=2782645 RepID=UPI001FF9F849|nr:MFS transporter [Bradyrhizobium sp. 174]MCK1572875.1 MFS transporter [Bradyrhizobium sp. 174]
MKDAGEYSAPSGRAWAVVGMLSLFMLVNFADKAVIGLSAVPIMRDLHLTNEQFGQVGSAFFFLFSLSAVLVGFVANRVPTRILLAVMGLIWALTQFPMLGAVSLPLLFACRITLGAGEGPAYPVAIHALYKWFPDEHRTFPTSLVAIGGTFGVGFIAPLITWMIVTYSWHVAFGFLGVVGVIWTAMWMVIGREGPLDVDRAEPVQAAAARVPYVRLLTARTALGVTIGGFAAYWAIALAIVWLPAFLIKAGGYTPTQTGWIVVLPSALQLIIIPGAGLLSQKLLRHGIPSRFSRGLFASGSISLAGASMILLSYSHAPAVQIPLVMLAFGVGAVIYSLGPPLLSEISPVGQRGAVLGLSNAVFSFAGLIAPWLTGHIVDVGTDPAVGFRQGFLFAGCLICAGGILAAILINPAKDLARFREGSTRLGGLAETSGDRDEFSESRAAHQIQSAH